MYNLNIKTLYKGTINLRFEDFSNFVWIAGHQIGILRGYVDDPIEYCNAVSNDYSKRFQEKEKLGVFSNLDSTSNILDIGSGVGILDMILYKYLEGGTFFLLDKNEVNHNHTVAHWDSKHGFYNQWNVFYDIAKNSIINVNDFNLLSPDDNWPNNLDLIMSSYSYMWHYPKDAYWNKIKYFKNTKLCFDILNRPDCIMTEINNELGKECSYIEKPALYFHWFIDDLELENGSPGKICFWQ